MRRVLFMIALLALVLGGPVPAAASMAPMMNLGCLDQCGASDQERATQPPCCATTMNCQVKAKEPGPYVNTTRWEQAATRNPYPEKEPNPCPPALVGMMHQLPQVQVRTPLRPSPRSFVEGRPAPLSRVCVLRI